MGEIKSIATGERDSRVYTSDIRIQTGYDEHALLSRDLVHPHLIFLTIGTPHLNMPRTKAGIPKPPNL
jgi:hypothetical protein